MIDRLAEIKSRAKPHLEIALDQPDISWLIAEVERLRDPPVCVTTFGGKLLSELVAENERLKDVDLDNERLRGHLDTYEKRLKEGVALLLEGAARIDQLKAENKVLRDHETNRRKGSVRT